VQAVPQLPQFVLLDCVLMHRPSPAPLANPPPIASAHCVSPAGQLQVPFVQEVPLHPVPHDPQLLALVNVSTQLDVIPPGPGKGPGNPGPVHLVSPASPQPGAQILVEHVVPEPQVLPQRPQFALSEVGSTHVEPQRMSDDEHWQAPFTQLPPFGHWWPHVPQLSGAL
jgi:hypothetical protein